jgi:hypothetical protein
VWRRHSVSGMKKPHIYKTNIAMVQRAVIKPQNKIRPPHEHARTRTQRQPGLATVAFVYAQVLSKITGSVRKQMDLRKFCTHSTDDALEPKTPSKTKSRTKCSRYLQGAGVGFHTWAEKLFRTLFTADSGLLPLQSTVWMSTSTCFNSELVHPVVQC